jgi:competence protein ComEC
MWTDKPAVAAALLISCGTYAARLLNVHWYVWGFLAAICLAVSLWTLIRFRRACGREIIRSVSFSFLLLFSPAAYSAAIVQLTPPTHIKHFLDTPKPLRLVCEIADEPRLKEGRTTSLVHVRSIAAGKDSFSTNGDALLTIVQNKRTNEKIREFRYGSLISLEGILNTPIASRNPGEFSYRDYLQLNNIFATVHVLGYSEVQVISEGTPNLFFKYVIFPSKHFILRVINEAMTGDEANFMIGLLLGDRTDLSADIKSAFVNTGTIHVLIVAGMRVALVAAIMYALFGLLRLPEREKSIAAIAGIIYYMELTGAAPPVVRASLMAITVLLARLFQERTNVYNSLGVSAVIILTYDPMQLFDAGFQLSYSAVFAIAYFYPKLTALIRKIPESLEEVKAIDYVLKLLAVSLAAQLGAIPFTAYFFGKVSLISLAANLVVVPIVEVIVIVGFVSVLAGIFSIWVSTCFNEVNNLLSWFALKFVMLANAVPYASIPTATFGFKEGFFYSVVVAALFNLTNKKLLRRLLLTLFAGINIILLLSLLPSRDVAPTNLRIDFLDVGQGDAAVIEFPSGEKFLVDAGPKTFDHDAGEKVVAPFLRRRGILKIDAIVVTHPHSDHVGGVPYLIRNFEVNRVIDASQRAQSALYYDYESLIPNIRHVVTAGIQLAAIPNVRLYTLHPINSFLDVDSTDGYDHLNNTSVVFKLVYGTTSFLFAGDAEIPVEEHLDSVYQSFLKSDVLKAGHHGSSTSSSEEFLTNVAPKEVIVSVGKFNKFRHPSRKVIQRFKDLGIKIHRTDEEGAIIFESDGTSISRVNWRKE